jgi:hypothetical protein
MYMSLKRMWYVPRSQLYRQGVFISVAEPEPQKAASFLQSEIHGRSRIKIVLLRNVNFIENYTYKWIELNYAEY